MACRRSQHASWRSSAGLAVLVLASAALPIAPLSAQTETIFRQGFEPLGSAPVVQVLRDDRVATVEMDYDAENPWGQFWVMSGDPGDDAGFLVMWWPEVPTQGEQSRALKGQDGAGCMNPDHFSVPMWSSPISGDGPPGARWLVTGNRRVQLQPLDNDRAYRVRVQRLNARGEIASLASETAFAGGDGARVAALRASLTAFDDFNLALGPADERLWNNAQMVSTDPRFNLFFINDQLHVHTINGTNVENTGDKSQTSQRFRKKLRLPASGERRIVFDMDSPLSPRSVWYLDLNPVAADLTGHASFFDEEGALGLPAGILRLRAQGQSLSASIVDLQGASHRIADVDMEQLGRQAISNVRRAFDIRVSTGHLRVLIDGRSAIDAPFAPHVLPASDYELLWVGFGYNTTKDGVPYFLQHWDNFGFDGPVVDARTTHNYVTRIEGTDYRKANRGETDFPTFSIEIPDALAPTVAGATAEAWLVWTYQMGDYSPLDVLPTDFVRINGTTDVIVPQPGNNTAPSNPSVMSWGMPHTARVKIADLVAGGPSPLTVGSNTVQFFVQNAGLLNLHLEVMYPAGSQPAYTPPAQIHHFPLHAELPRVGPPARLTTIDDTGIGADQLLGAETPVPIDVDGATALDIEIGNASWAGWARELMRVPVTSTEVWSTGGTAGIASVEVFLRPAQAGAGSGPGERVAWIDTAVDAPAPQGRYRLWFDAGDFANGDYQLFVRATTPSGLHSHPSYGDELHFFDTADLSGAYYPIPIRIDNSP